MSKAEFHSASANAGLLGEIGNIKNNLKVSKVKTLKAFLVLALLFSGVTFGGSVNAVFAQADSVNIMVEASLFFEAYKNKQYDDFTFEHGWKMLNAKPDAFIQYKPYNKLEKVIWHMYNDTTGQVSAETKKMLADTVIHLYDMAVKNDTADACYFLVKKAYVMEVWRHDPVDSVIKTYEEAFNCGKPIENANYYKDRLGALYIKNATDSNGYKMKALELYSKLSEEEPDNAIWNARLESLAENEDQLLGIYYKAWQLSKDNLEKAWKYASFCIRTQNFEKAIEPLEFLVEKSPDVVNYWRELARAYDKIGKTDKAISAYKKLISLEPDNRDNYVNLAIIYKKLNQLSVARSYLMKAMKVSPDWDYPHYILGTIYEQAARDCGFEFMDKCVYLLAVNEYKKAASLHGSFSEIAAERVKALKDSVPSTEDYFFRQLKSGDKIKIEGKCYDWIKRSVVVP